MPCLYVFISCHGICVSKEEKEYRNLKNNNYIRLRIKYNSCAVEEIKGKLVKEGCSAHKFCIEKECLARQAETLNRDVPEYLKCLGKKERKQIVACYAERYGSKNCLELWDIFVFCWSSLLSTIIILKSCYFTSPFNYCIPWCVQDDLLLTQNNIRYILIITNAMIKFACGPLNMLGVLFQDSAVAFQGIFCCGKDVEQVNLMQACMEIMEGVTVCISKQANDIENKIRIFNMNLEQLEERIQTQINFAVRKMRDDLYNRELEFMIRDAQRSNSYECPVPARIPRVRPLD